MDLFTCLFLWYICTHRGMDSEWSNLFTGLILWYTHRGMDSEWQVVFLLVYKWSNSFLIHWGTSSQWKNNQIDEEIPSSRYCAVKYLFNICWTSTIQGSVLNKVSPHWFDDFYLECVVLAAGPFYQSNPLIWHRVSHGQWNRIHDTVTSFMHFRSAKYNEKQTHAEVLWNIFQKTLHSSSPCICNIELDWGNVHKNPYVLPYLFTLGLSLFFSGWSLNAIQNLYTSTRQNAVKNRNILMVCGIFSVKHHTAHHSGFYRVKVHKNS